MSRIGNKLKAGYVATQEIQGAFMRQLLQYTANVSILDTCCGEGAILRQLADNTDYHIATYGVELDKHRAEKAIETLDHAVQAPIESMVISNDAFGMIYLNPPYDFAMRNDEDESERKEFIELQRATRFLQPGGVLLYVIPHYRFADKKISRFLATHFNEISIARFTEENYHEFKQCMFIGRKKRGTFKEFNQPLFDAFRSLENEEMALKLPDLEQLVNKGKQWTIPSGRTDIPTFYSRLENKDVFVDTIRESKGFQAFIERTKPKNLELDKQPIIPLAQGQIALLLASGAINGLVSADSPDGVHVVRGMEVVSKVVSKEETESSVTTKIRTKREVSVKFITPDGVVKKLM